MKEWYVVHTQPNNEAKATFNLKRQNFDVYLPLFRRKRRHAGRIELVPRPFFPGYLFVVIDPEHERWRSVNGTFGVRHLITQGNQPLPVPISVIESLKCMEDSFGLITPGTPSFAPGQRIEICEGPMAMHVGLFCRMSEKERVVLLLHILGREVAVSIPRTAVIAA